MKIELEWWCEECKAFGTVEVTEAFDANKQGSALVKREHKKKNPACKEMDAGDPMRMPDVMDRGVN